MRKAIFLFALAAATGCVVHPYSAAAPGATASTVIRTPTADLALSQILESAVSAETAKNLTAAFDQGYLTGQMDGTAIRSRLLYEQRSITCTNVLVEFYRSAPRSFSDDETSALDVVVGQCKKWLDSRFKAAELPGTAYSTNRLRTAQIFQDLTSYYLRAFDSGYRVGSLETVPEAEDLAATNHEECFRTAAYLVDLLKFGSTSSVCAKIDEDHRKRVVKEIAP